tara:strand:- start:163 stop:474 length:312 start_codon:yes stop_codon:yes gene_type:complete
MNSNSNVCEDQSTFNTAYAKAVNNYGDYMNKKMTPGQRILYTMLAFLQLMFIIWAVILAMKMPGPNRPVNVTLAILTGPIYIIAYYISMAGNGNGNGSSMKPA